ncbi:MAG: serine hydrolase [Bacteroidia bacterium]|nr:serine hydrolase [Bacteroidia bacterium]
MLRLIALQFIFTSFLSAQELSVLNPTGAGYKPDFFKKIGKETLDSVPSIGSFLVWKNSGIVYEAYFNGQSDTTHFQLKSVTKTITSALAGIAKDKGLLPSLETPVLNVLTEYSLNVSEHPNVWYPDVLYQTDLVKRTLTLKNLLCMQTGLLWDDNNVLSHRAFQSSSDPVRYVLELPYECQPGTSFKYCTGGSHVMAAAIARCAKTNLRTFADSTLFKPLGIHINHWTNDPMGRTSGGTELSMKSRDMLRFGLLYLNEGVVNNKQVISKSWIKESTAEHVELNEWDVLPGANGYGYYWWRRKTNGHQAFVASGYGGQLICIVPDLKLIVVTTCLVNELNRGRSEIKRLHKIIDKVVKASL